MSLRYYARARTAAQPRRPPRIGSRRSVPTTSPRSPAARRASPTRRGSTAARRREGRTTGPRRRCSIATCCARRDCSARCRTTVVPVPEVLWEDAGDPPDVPPLFVMTFVEGTLAGAAVRRRTATIPSPSWPSACANAARTLGRPARSRPVGDRPGRRAASSTWPTRSTGGVDLLETVDPSLAPGWAARWPTRCVRREPPTDARRGRARRLPARQPAGRRCRPSPRSSTGRSGRWVIRGSTSAGSSPTPTRDLPARDARTRVRCRRPTSCSTSTPTRSVATSADVEWFQALACFKSTATWSLIVKHNRRRAEPDPEVEAMAAILPRPARPGSSLS